MGKQIGLKEATERIRLSQNGSVSIIDYSAMKNPATFLCLICNEKWQVKHAIDIVSGNRHCPNCWKNRRSETNRMPIETVVKIIEENGCQYIDGDYLGSKSSLLIKFSCGHSDWVTFDVFKNSVTFLCRKCQKRRIGDKFKDSEDEIRRFLDSINLTLLGFPDGYLNGRSIVTYRCNNSGHVCSVQYNTIKRKKKCSECAFKEQYENRKGKNHPLWNGGTSSISPLIKGRMIEWKKESIKNSKYKCVLTGDKFQAVHHLYSFNMILEEVLENLNIKNKNYVYEYTEQEINEIIEESKKVHKKYLLGVCLRKDVHILFHQIYGSKNNTPEQFYEFVDRIESGEIIINK